MDGNTSIDRQTTITQARYNRIAPLYDAMEWFTERTTCKRWREELWSCMPEGRILEVGVGTGKNMAYYTNGAEMTAIDLSSGILTQARRKAKDLDITVDLYQMDAQCLEFPDNAFDASVATFVFCSVPFAVRGLRELKRVVKPDGDIWLMEHVRINKPVIGRLMDFVNPVVVRMMGANINRQTVENVRNAGLEIVAIENLHGELIKLIHASP